MVVFGNAQQSDAQQRPVHQVKGARGLPCDERLDPQALVLASRQRLDRDRQAQRGVDHRAHLVVLLDKRGTQALVALDQQIETVFQRPHIKLPPQAQDHRDVIRGAVRVELPQEPLALLGE
ncbi:hypothetical protein PS627_04546 [Pseudomonas fluorescens]|nr:hypothetical protein PS627_04546 [Pseudomonas fluorescens]